MFLPIRTIRFGGTLFRIRQEDERERGAFLCLLHFVFTESLALMCFTCIGWINVRTDKFYQPNYVFCDSEKKPVKEWLDIQIC